MVETNKSTANTWCTVVVDFIYFFWSCHDNISESWMEQYRKTPRSTWNMYSRCAGSSSTTCGESRRMSAICWAVNWHFSLRTRDTALTLFTGNDRIWGWWLITLCKLPDKQRPGFISQFQSAILCFYSQIQSQFQNCHWKINHCIHNDCYVLVLNTTAAVSTVSVEGMYGCTCTNEMFVDIFPAKSEQYMSEQEEHSGNIRHQDEHSNRQWCF